MQPYWSLLRLLNQANLLQIVTQVFEKSAKRFESC